MPHPVHIISWRKMVGISLCWLLAVVSLFLTLPLAVAYLKHRSSTLLPSDPQSLYALIELVALVVALFCILWLTALLTLLLLCCALRAGHRGWARGESVLRALTPRAVRHLLAAVLGLGVSATTFLPAHAASDQDPFDVPLEWSAQSLVANPEVQALPAGQEIAAEPIAVSNQADFRFPEDVSTDSHGSTDSHTVTVAPGDSLWKIAKRHLPTGATDAEIDEAWRRWYALNEERIGSNPNHIEPGINLNPPS